MFRVNTAITFIVRLVSFILQILRSIIAARALGPNGRGVLSIIYTTVQIVFTVIEGGLSIANVYFVGKRRYAEGEVFINALVTAGVCGLGAIAVTLFWFTRSGDSLGNFPAVYFYVAVSMLPLALLAQYGATIFQGRHEIVTFNLLKLVEPFVFFVAFVFMVEVLRWEVAGAVYANAVSVIVYCGLAVWLVWRIRGIRFRFNGRIFGAALRFGLQGHLGNIGVYLHNRFNVFLINYYTDMEYVGIYAVSVVVAESLLYIPNSLTPVLYPIVVSNHRQDINYFTAIVCRNTVFLCATAGLVLLVVAELLVRGAFGAEFAEAITPVRILVPGMVAFCVTSVLNSYLNGIGRPTLPSVVSWVMFLVNVPVNVLLIPKWGLIGAALASTFSYSIGMFITVFIFSEITKIDLRDLFIIRRDDLEYYREFAGRFLKRGRTTPPDA
jgi:O-antigen/teichoic acid export membrane protein